MSSTIPILDPPRLSSGEILGLSHYRTPLQVGSEQHGEAQA